MATIPMLPRAYLPNVAYRDCHLSYRDGIVPIVSFMCKIKYFISIAEQREDVLVRACLSCVSTHTKRRTEAKERKGNGKQGEAESALYLDLTLRWEAGMAN